MSIILAPMCALVSEGRDSGWNDARTIIAILALGVSLVSLIASIWVAWQTHKWAVRPTLVFTFDGVNAWVVRNAGNGPALDVLVAKIPLRRPPGDWQEPVRLPSLGKDASFALSWLGATDLEKIGCIYRDVSGRMYSSISEREITSVARRRRLPVWREEEIEMWWRKVRDNADLA